MSDIMSDRLSVVTNGGHSEASALKWSRRFDVFGVQVSAITFDAAESEILEAARRNIPAVVSHHDVRALIDASREADLRKAANSFQIIAPDGQPIRWALNLLYGMRLRDPITGTELMRRLCARAAREGISVYLYGSTPEVLASLQATLFEQCPGLKLAGTESPPFRALSTEEDRETVQRINQSGAGIVFLGLGYPKQDRFAYEHRNSIQAVQICVGAAFDFLSGNKTRAPRWMQRCGLEWSYRLVKEPRRLWRRYLVANSVFLAKFALAALRRCNPLRRPRNAGHKAAGFAPEDRTRRDAAERFRSTIPSRASRHLKEQDCQEISRSSWNRSKTIAVAHREDGDDNLNMQGGTGTPSDR